MYWAYTQSWKEGKSSQIENIFQDRRKVWNFDKFGRKSGQRLEFDWVKKKKIINAILCKCRSLPAYKIDHCIITNIHSFTILPFCGLFCVYYLVGSMAALNCYGFEIKRFGLKKVWNYLSLKVGTLYVSHAKLLLISRLLCG